MEPTTTKKPHDTKILVLWVAAIAILVGAAFILLTLVAPVMQVRRVIADVSPDDAEDHARCARVVNMLGGEADAARKLGLYLRMHERFAPKKTAAVCVLAATGRPGYPVMIANLDHPSMEVASAVAWKMCQGHESARLAVPRLTRMAQGQYDLTAYSALIALGKVGPEAGEAVPALIGCLKHEDAGRRRYAAQALGLIGDKRAIEPLKAILADQDEAARTAAEDALRKLAGA